MDVPLLSRTNAGGFLEDGILGGTVMTSFVPNSWHQRRGTWSLASFEGYMPSLWLQFEQHSGSP